MAGFSPILGEFWDQLMRVEEITASDLLKPDRH
ncbi:hypothetical protein MPC1_330007 [Methylocella tundrae]|nr:hypothetical protein MPC1_330007 [Methylocella tundrae]